MFKKIIFYLSVLAVVIPAGVAGAYEHVRSESNPEIGLLSELEIFTGDIQPEAFITRGEFASATAKLIGCGNDENPIEFLASFGIMTGNGYGDFRENDIITANEAAKMLVSALGYDVAAKHSGGYPAGYFATAHSLDIMLQGLTGVQELCYNDAARLLVNAGNVKEADNTYAAEGSYLYVSNSKTVFEKYHNIYSCDGIVTSNEYTDFDGGNGEAGLVCVNGLSLEVGNSEAGNYLGCNVQVYYTKTDSETLVRYIYPARKNSTLVLNRHNDAEAAGNLQEFKVSYITDEGSRKTISVKNYRPFRNGKYDEYFLLDSINNLTGTVEFIDNNGDGNYEIVKLFEYSHYFVESVDESRDMVFAKYDKSLKLNVTEDCRIIKINGDDGTLSDISAGDVLSVLESRDNTFKLAYISNRTVTGTIEQISEKSGEKIIGFYNDRYYVISPFFKNLTGNKVELEIGAYVQLVLDKDGEVIDIVSKNIDSWKYGFVVKAFFGDDEESEKALQLFTDLNSIKRYPLKNKVNIDGARCYGNAIKTSLTNSRTGTVDRQLIRFKEYQGYITEIDTEMADASGNTDNSLSYVPEVRNETVRYNSNSRYLYSGSTTVAGAGDETVILTVPVSSKYYDEPGCYRYSTYKGGFGTVSYNDTDSRYIEAYNMGDMQICKIFIRYCNIYGQPDASMPVMLVTQTGKAVNSEGEVCDVLSGWDLSSNKQVEYNVMENAYTFEAKFGDLVHIALLNSEIRNAARRFDITNDTTPDTLLKYSKSSTTSTEENSYASEMNVFCGKLIAASSTHASIATDASGTDRTSFWTEGRRIYLCNMKDEAVEEISAAELGAYTVYNNPDADFCVITKSGIIVAGIVFITNN